MVQKLELLDPVQAHQLKGLLAEKEKNYPLAESEFKAAVEASGQAPDAWMTLSSYYARRKQWDQMLAALHTGMEADAKAAKPHGPALVDGAGILSRHQREPQLATQLLQLYLASPNQSADAPAFQVHVQLSRLLEQQGDQPEPRNKSQPQPPLPVTITRLRRRGIETSFFAFLLPRSSCSDNPAR